MKPKLLPVITLIASLMLAKPALAAADGGHIKARKYNGKMYYLTAPPEGVDPLDDERPSDDKLRKYYANCYRHDASFGKLASRIVRYGETSLWYGWYCPSNKPDPKPTPTPDPDPNKTTNPTPNPKPTPNTPKGCGSMVNGKWVEVSCDPPKKTDPQPTPTPNPTPTPTEPTTPTIPTVPKVPDLPDTGELKALKQALEGLSKIYQKKFNDYRDEGIQIKKYLAESLSSCALIYSGEKHKECAEREIKRAQQKMDELQKAIDAAQQQMQKDFAELAKQIASVPNVSGITINIPGQSSAGNVDVNTGGNGNGGNGDGSGGGNNITNNITNNNTTIIHNNHNNGGSGGGSGGGTGIGGNGSQQGGKDYSNALKEINNSLNNIEKQLSKGSNDKGNNDKGNDGKGNDANDGKGDKGNPDGKPDGEDKGETLSEYCKNNPNALACTKLGDQEEIDKAFQEGKGKDKGHPFGMGEHEIGIPQISRSHDFVESGVCPAPKQVMVLGAMQEFSYQPMCDFASKIRPAVIVSAILLAFFIVQASISKA